MPLPIFFPFRLDFLQSSSLFWRYLIARDFTMGFAEISTAIATIVIAATGVISLASERMKRTVSKPEGATPAVDTADIEFQSIFLLLESKVERLQSKVEHFQNELDDLRSENVQLRTKVLRLKADVLFHQLTDWFAAQVPSRSGKVIDLGCPQAYAWGHPPASSHLIVVLGSSSLSRWS